MPLRSYLDGRVFAEVSDGPGPLIAGLHGWGRDRNDLRTALAKYRRILIDLPGFGLSAAPPAAWGSADYAACVAALLEEHHRGEPAVLVGHSFGGRVAVCLAAARPDLVRGLVLCGAPLLRDAGAAVPPAGYRVSRRAHRLGLLSGQRFEVIRRARGSDDYNSASGIMREVLVRVVNESYDTQLAAIRCPVALLWGSNDQSVPPSVAGRASALLPAPAVTEVVAGAGHDVHLQAPARLTALVGQVAAAGRVPSC
ncbi:MAG TPA: alpha/beta hydrolase [Streptosporangiaceae bacterium]|nr:alpha/beta hydrolase [Streptosporangiaceae bacterium]